MAILLHNFSATSNTWVEKKIAPPSETHSCIIFFSRKVALGSSPTKGSSKINSLGECTSAEIMAVRCFIPCEYEEIIPERCSVISNKSPYFCILSLRIFVGISNKSAIKLIY